MHLPRVLPALLQENCETTLKLGQLRYYKHVDTEPRRGQITANICNGKTLSIILLLFLTRKSIALKEQ